MPLHLHRAGPEQVADGRHYRLAVAGSGAGRPADRDDGGELLPKVAEVAQRHPNLKLILDHLGRPRGDATRRAWANRQKCSRLRNIQHRDESDRRPELSDQPYPFRDIHDNLHRLYDAFGPARWFWGTDITRMPCPWRQCVTLFTEELPWLKGHDLELVMGRGLRLAGMETIGETT